MDLAKTLKKKTFYIIDGALMSKHTDWWKRTNLIKQLILPEHFKIVLKKYYRIAFLGNYF